MMWKRISRLVFHCALLLFIACGQGKPTPASNSDRGYPLAILVIETTNAELRMEVEIAETPEARAQGLMGVEDLRATDGMVFLFDSSTDGGFWMKNTLIPLDIAFWNDEMTIVDILQMEPCLEDPCQIYKPGASYVGAVEVEKNRLGEEGVKVGDRVDLIRKGLSE